jgi:protein translocase SecG subunit
MNITPIIQILQIIVSVLLIALILMQQRGSAMGSAFGQDTGASLGTKRGMQKTISSATIVSAALFIVLAILNLII